MTTVLAEMNRSEVTNWLMYHAESIAVARDEWIEATRKYATFLAKCNGAFENGQTTADSFATDRINGADNALADELKRDFGL